MDGVTMVTDNLVLGTMSINQILVVFNCSRESLSLRYWNTGTVLTVLQPVKGLLLVCKKRRKILKLFLKNLLKRTHVLSHLHVNSNHIWVQILYTFGYTCTTSFPKLYWSLCMLVLYSFSWCAAMPTLWHSQMKVLSIPGGRTLTDSWAQGTRPIRYHLQKSWSMVKGQ